MGAFTSIAQGIGRAGSELGQGADLLRQARIQEFERQLEAMRAKLEGERVGMEGKRIGFEGRRLELEERTANQPRVIGTHQDLFGNLHVIEQDPKTGQTSTRKIFDARTGNMAGLVNDIEGVIQQVPQERQSQLRSMLKPYIDVGDYIGAMKLASSYASKLTTERPFSIEEQALERAEAERKAKGQPPMSSEELTKFHEKYQPYGAQRIQIQREGLQERTLQDVLKDVNEAQKQIKPIDDLKDLMDRALPGVESPSGEGDVKLLSAYVAATKPPVGFRWTDTEVRMITGARGIAAAAAVKFQRLGTGILFSDQQRKDIGGTIKQLSDSLAQRKGRLIDTYTQVDPKLKPFLSTLTGPNREVDMPKDLGVDFVLEKKP